MEDHRNERFVEADFDGACFRGVNFSNVKVTDAWLVNVELSGTVSRLAVNGIDVTGYVERELDERNPERRLLTSGDPDGMRSAWRAIEIFATATLECAQRLPPDLLSESVDGEWSYLETLRHLVYATDRWLTGPVFHDPKPFHRLGMPNPPLDEVPAGLFDLEASPSLDEILMVRRERMSRVSAYLETVSGNDLNQPVRSPNGGMTSVRACFHVVFREEWWHNQYATRDLAVLADR
jgi:DinB superfamily/Pentapeptide repeats (8 copies)